MPSFNGNLHGATSLIISPIEPTSTKTGLIWQNSTTGEIKIFDGTSFKEVPDVTARAISNLEGGDNVVYPHSTTIGDYTQPNDAVGSSHDASNVIPDYQQTLSDSNRTFGRQAGFPVRVGVKIQAGHSVVGKIVTKVGFFLSKLGSPTGIATIVIRDIATDSIKLTLGTIDVSTLTTSPVLKTFENLTGHKIVADDRIMIEKPAVGNDSNHVLSRIQGNNVDANILDTKFVSSYSDDANIEHKIDIHFATRPVTNTVDNNVATRWKSKSEINPNVYVDMGSLQDIVLLAIHPHANMTETEIKIQTSSDAITWIDRRTITVSDLTNEVWNFIRFNASNHRYVRIFGNSGSSLVLAINEIKILTVTDLLARHGHLVISTSNTALNFDGTAP